VVTLLPRQISSVIVEESLRANFSSMPLNEEQSVKFDLRFCRQISEVVAVGKSTSPPPTLTTIFSQEFFTQLFFVQIQKLQYCTLGPVIQS
jgi:hypothetical protein